MKLEWRPKVKNGGRPLGDVYKDGEWDGFMEWGEVGAYAESLGVKRVKVVGPLADYHRACRREERAAARRAAR